MANDDQRSLPSITVRTGEPRWNCQCKPETRCRVVVEIPPPAPKYRSIWWTIKRPAQLGKPLTQKETSTGKGSSKGAGAGNTAAKSGTSPPTLRPRQVSVPLIETLPDSTEDAKSEAQEVEFESEEEVDELEDD